MNAKTHRPAHGGYPAAPKTRRRLTAGLPGTTPAEVAAGGPRSPGAKLANINIVRHAEPEVRFVPVPVDRAGRCWGGR